MSKRNSDGDVIANRLSLVEAKGQRLLASLLGPKPDSPSSNDGAFSKDDDDDLKEEYGHDRLGVGGILPKDVEDGSFVKRAPTSSDKLLEQLIGKKRAKAHLAAKQQAARSNAKPSRQEKPATKRKEESEDEEEGRAATFKSKRRKENVPNPVQAKEDVRRGGNEGSSEASERDEDAMKKAAKVIVKPQDKQVEDDEEAGAAKSPQNAPSRKKAKPTSFLDEMLADRSKKKKMKDKM